MLVTFGHGTAGQGELLALLRGAGIGCVIDVRTAPGSRAHPHVARRALEQWLPAAGVGYRWEPRLGGFRRPAADSPDTFWRHPSFRGYAAHLRTPDAQAALHDLLDAVTGADGGGEGCRTTVMCSESLWWRCHRRLLADTAQLTYGLEVRHLMHDARLVAHPTCPGARLTVGGRLVYDRNQ